LKPLQVAPLAQLAACLLLLAAFVAASGCGDGRLETYPVIGSVLVDSKPADGAMVIFCPTTGPEELLRMRPFGFTGPDGKFELTTFDKADGLPAGEYKIIIRWPTGGAGSRSPDRLKGKYMNLEQSQLTATIGPDSGELPPFELKTK